MLGLGLQATLKPQGSGQIHPVQDGLVLADNFRLSPVNDNLGLEFPAEGTSVFNGTSDYIQLPDSFSYTNHTIAAWVYAKDTGNNKFIFDNRDVLYDGVLFRSSTTESIQYYINNGVGAVSTSTFVNEWVFAVGTYDGTTAKLYINGSIEGTESISSTINVSSDSRIGTGNITLGTYMDGNLANVAIWNRALTSDEINSVMWKNYNQVTNSERVGLQAWYALSSYYTDWAAYATSQGATIEGETCANNALNALDLL